MLILSRLYLSFFGVGFFPKAPGTMGSIATIPFLYLCLPLIQKYAVSFYLLFTIVLIGTCLLTEHVQQKLKAHDPQWIVMDEALGMFTTWFFFPSEKLHHLIILLVLFRFFDIIKFWPASYFDRMKHGAGTILDDIISGIYAGIVYWLIVYAEYSYF